MTMTENDDDNTNENSLSLLAGDFLNTLLHILN